MLTWGRSVLRQHRAAWVQHGRTASILGGALAMAETPIDAALREAREEAGLTLDDVRPTDAEHVVESVPEWTYTTIV